MSGAQQLPDDERLARAFARVLAEHAEAPAAIAALARLAAEREPERGWPGRLELPVEREVELLARALLDRFESGTHAAELAIELCVTRWRGRPDGCELALAPGDDGARHASPLLARVVRAAGEEPEPLVLELALACAAALVRAALERIDDELAVGAAGALEVAVRFPTGPGRTLGHFDGAWHPPGLAWERRG